nr:histone acetyltransferase esa1 [Quercus suber]
MAPRHDGKDGANGSDEVKPERSIATLAQLRVGVKAMVAVEKDGGTRKAEILSVQSRPNGMKYYVHYEGFNKRLDTWITPNLIDLTQEVEWPIPEKPDSKSKQKSAQSKNQAAVKNESKSQQKLQKRPRSATATREASEAPHDALTRVVRQEGGKENRDPAAVLVTTEDISGTPHPDDGSVIDLVEMKEAAATAKAVPDQEYSREEEIEKLRVGGSMTQNQTEISRVRNLERIQMGMHEIEPWYFSPYPAEFSDCDMVFICEFCLSYFGDKTRFNRHRQKCTLLHPPGNEIYRDDNVSFFEIDGRRQRTWCRNLCLLSKLFLDHKTLYYDVDPFLFYCMTVRDEHGHHLVGYFSKEKDCAEGYNVACILTVPQWQRKGYGKLLIQFSYELSKIENKLGSPEKPLSDLGLLGYRAFWQEVIVDYLVERTEAGSNSPMVSIEELGAALAMTTMDVMHTLQNLNMLRYSNKNHVIVLTDAVVAQREKQKEKEKIKGRRSIEPDRLIWKPPVFSAAARSWNCCRKQGGAGSGCFLCKTISLSHLGTFGSIASFQSKPIHQSNCFQERCFRCRTHALPSRCGFNDEAASMRLIYRQRRPVARLRIL